jgi:hypothetical protein
MAVVSGGAIKCALLVINETIYAQKLQWNEKRNKDLSTGVRRQMGIAAMRKIITGRGRNPQLGYISGSPDFPAD